MAFDVREIERDEAARALDGAAGCDPLGIATPADLVRNSDAFEGSTDAGRGVFAARIERTDKGAVLWIDGAQSEGGSSLLAQGLALFEEMARQSGCGHVAFETNRVGLVRAVEKHGYAVSGYVIMKEINHG